jgi:hypothetical protein
MADVTYQINYDPNEPTLQDELLERRFKAKDIKGVSYAMLNYWNEKGFLFQKQKPGEWRKFNFVEMTWVYMLNELRELNVELKTVVPAIKNAFEITGAKWGLHPETGDFISGAGINAQGKPDSPVPVLINPARYGFYIEFAIANKSALTVRIYPGAKVAIQTSDTIDENEYLKEMMDFSKSFTSISMSGVIAKALGDKEIPTIKALGLLSENELLLLKYLRNDELKEVLVRYAEGEPYMLELTSEMSVSDKNVRLFEMMQSPYEEITLKTNGGKTYAFERTTKMKLK